MSDPFASLSSFSKKNQPTLHNIQNSNNQSPFSSPNLGQQQQFRPTNPVGHNNATLNNSNPYQNNANGYSGMSATYGTPPMRGGHQPTPQQHSNGIHSLGGSGIFNNNKPNSGIGTPQQRTSVAGGGSSSSSGISTPNSAANAFAGLGSLGNSSNKPNNVPLSQIKPSNTNQMMNQMNGSNNVPIGFQQQNYINNSATSSANNSMPSFGNSNIQNSFKPPPNGVPLAGMMNNTPPHQFNAAMMSNNTGMKVPQNNTVNGNNNNSWDLDFLDPNSSIPKQPTSIINNNDEDLLGDLAKPVSQFNDPFDMPPEKPDITKGVAGMKVESPPDKKEQDQAPSALDTIVEMGFSREEGQMALASADNDLERAIAMLVSGSVEKKPSPSRHPKQKSSGFSEERYGEPSGHDQYNPGFSDRQTNLENQTDKIISAATSIGMSVFSGAKSAFQMSKQKITTMAAERGFASNSGSPRPDRYFAENPSYSESDPPLERYRDDFSSDSSDDEAPAIRNTPHRNTEPKNSLLDVGKAPEAVPSSSGSSSLFSTPSPPKRQMPPPKPKVPELSIPPGQLSVIESNKQAGNNAYKSGDFATAEGGYTEGINSLSSQYDLSSYQHAIVASLYLNRAQARIKNGLFKGAVDDASIIVRVCENGGYANTTFQRALQRRSEAYESLEKYGEALADLKRICEVGGSTPAVSGAMSRCLKALDPKTTDSSKYHNQNSGNLSSSPFNTSSTQMSFDPFSNSAQLGQNQTLPINGAAPVKPKRAAPKREDPYVTNAVNKAVDALREQNEAAEKKEDMKLSLKDSVDQRIEVWRNGKRDNLRALLSSLDTVVWPALNWKNIGLSELIQPNQVKSKYMRAVAKLHPDKLGPDLGVEESMIAAGVFSTLNEAWDAFKLQNGLS